MEHSAIVHFSEKRYCYALEKGRFIFRIETKKDDIKKIVLHTRDKYIPLKRYDSLQHIEMKKIRSDKYKDYYEAVVELNSICTRYFFEMTDYENKTEYFANHIFYDFYLDDVDYMYDCPQNMREEEIFNIPKWAENSIIYQIFPSRFATDENIEDDVWYQKPMQYNTDIRGNLRGIINHLDYIKELGVDIIYLTPIFKSSSSHKYNIDDYYTIDSNFGTNEDFKELVDKIHKMGMRIILDGVFNHTSTDFFAFKDVCENEDKSKYVDWYYIDGFPLQTEFGQKPNYLSFAYASVMPKLNLSNVEVQDYVIDIAKYWIEEYGIDGWRLDVGDEISHFFWRRFRRKIKEANPDVLIVGEIWHFAGEFLEGDEWDSVMNYQFFDSIKKVVAKESVNVSEFVNNQNFLMGHLNSNSYGYLWNLIGSHDTERFRNMCGGDVRKLMLGAAFLLLHRGMPMLYYGDEVGMEGAKDPDCRRGMLWNEDLQNKEVLNFYKKIIKIRKEFDIITLGEYENIETDDKKGILIEELSYLGNKLTIVYNCRDNDNKIDRYTGLIDLVSEKIFDGVIHPYEVMIF